MGGGIVLLQAAALMAWNGLTYAETLRSERVSRKYIERDGLLHARLGDRDGLFPDPGQTAIDTARANELATRHKIIRRTHWSSSLAGFGFTLLFVAFVQVIEGRDNALGPVPESPPPEKAATAAAEPPKD